MSASLTVYKASAGSGKTFTLAVQYIARLLSEANGTAYRHILAVTFTNKATAEMKDRILGQLYGIWKGISSAKAYLKAIRNELKENGQEGLDDTEIRRRAGRVLCNLLHDYSRFRVETIDAFFQTVLKNLAHELSLTANLQVDLNDTEMVSRAVDRIMTRLHLDAQALAWIWDFVDDRIRNDERWDVTRETKDFAKWLFDATYLKGSNALKPLLDDNRHMTHYRRTLQEIQEQAVDTLTSAVEHFREELEAYGIDATDFKSGATLNTYLNKLGEADFEAEFKPTLEKYLEAPENMLVKAKLTNAEWMETAEHFRELLQEIRSFQTSLAEDYNTATLALKHLNPLRLLGIIDEEVTALTQETNRFLLAKAPILLHNLIEDSDAPFIFEKMGTELRHVMIDEFQDTSTLQWSNLKVLLLENLASGGSSLLVGDVKQSIYRWRNGDWTILNNIHREMASHCPHIRHLDINYRSERRIVAFNSTLFQRAAQQLDDLHPDAGLKLAEAYADVEQHLPPGREENGFVRVTFYPSRQKKENAGWEEQMLDDLCEQVDALHRNGVPYTQMAILLRKRRHAAPIVEHFARRMPEVTLVSDEAFRLSASSGVCMLIAALRLLDDPTDRVSTAYLALHYRQEVLKSETELNELLLTDPAKHLPKAFFDQRQRLRLMPLYELQEELFRLFSLNWLTQQDAYFFAYFDEVTTYLQDNPSDIHSFLTYWDEQLAAKPIPSGEADGIRLLTIHKAKGLQFHTVLIPYAHWDVERDNPFGGSTDLLWCAPEKAPYDELPLLPVTPCPRMRTSIFRKEYEEEHLQRRVDALNTLYVALTRAEKNLLIWGKAKDKLTESSTVGDLLYTALPRENMDMETGDNETETYSCGTPMTCEEAPMQRNNNRLEPAYEPLPVEMKSFATAIDFRQSNRSEQFIRRAGEDTDTGISALEEEQDAYIRQGKLLHYIFSTLHTADELERVLRRVETEGILNREIPKERLRKWVTRGLERPLVADWFSGRYQLYNECSILSTDPESGMCIVRRPDRVMMSDTEIIVTDFKFGRPRPAYHEQVRQYMQLLHAMEPGKAVKGYLWFVYTNQIEEIKETEI